MTTPNPFALIRRLTVAEIVRLTEGLRPLVAELDSARAEFERVSTQMAEVDRSILEIVPLYDEDNGARITEGRNVYQSDDDAGAAKFEAMRAEWIAEHYPEIGALGWCPALTAGDKLNQCERAILAEGAKMIPIFAEPRTFGMRDRMVSLLVGLVKN